ncbi:MAG: associated Golgi protein [Symbiobacteriaceae bacterium]|jgi:membrane protein DedA with SNARE-associated domain|nr:associated Golgi protein [Symbiobacteriaceae bacterium]
MIPLLYGAAAVMVSAVIEGLGVPWPAELLLTTTGAQYEGFLAAIVIGGAFAIAYTAGATVQYLIGRFFAHLLDRWVEPRTLAKLDRVFAKHGQFAVLWMRPVPALGNLLSIPAGMMRMHIGKFVLYTLLGIWPWAVATTYLGTLAGGVLGPYVRLLPYMAGGIVVITLASGIRALYLRRK